MSTHLLIHIENITEAGYFLEFKEPWNTFAAPDGSVDADGAIELRTVAGNLNMQRVGDLLRVGGRVEAQLQAVCSRCLNAADQFLNITLDLHYTRRSSPQSGPQSGPQSDRLHQLQQEQELDWKKEAAGLYLFSGDILDLREAIYEQIIMALPIRMLCRDTCKGLCHHCGADLNKAACDCTRPNWNGPFAVLRQYGQKKS